MLLRKPMKSLFVLALAIFGFTANATKVAKETPVANAGSNQTIYLTQTSTVTLDGRGSSGEKYEWRDVSTDYKSGATITSPNSSVTTVTGLKQGVWYFQLAVTSSAVTATDVVVIKVDYDAPPANGTLIHHFDFVDNAPVIDKRDDTTSFFPVSNYQYSQTNGDSNGDDWFYFRDRTNGLYIDQEKGKLVTTIEDGYQGTAGYARGEVQLADYSFTIDTMHTYVFEWKGYYPQNINFLVGSASWHSILNMFQIHSYKQTATVYSYGLTADDSIHLSDTYDDGTGNLVTFQKYVASRQNFYNNAHTIRVTVREGKGYLGQTAFIKSEIDGVTNYYRNTGQVGSSYFDDFVKFAGLYDYNHFIVNVDSIARGRKFKLVTEAFNIYQMSNNQPPTVSAGSDQTITLPTNNVTLSGSGKDPDGTIASYHWSQISGPSGVTILDVNSCSTDVNGLTQGVYQFQIKVTDNQGATATVTTQITVKAATNNPPKANAGSDQTITLPKDSINLSGSGSDSDGLVASYLWKQIAGTTVTITNSSSAAATVRGLIQGSYQFELTVTDDKGATGKDTAKVTVNPAIINKAPVADAGSDQTITLPTNNVTLSGSGKDADGTIASYQWSQISGPSEATIRDVNSSSTDVNGLTPGVYQFQIKVADNQGATATATTQIIVKAATNNPLKANAGSDQTITLPKDSVSLSGSGSDSDGLVASYLWRQIAGTTVTIANSSSAAATVKGLIQGSYQFELTVTDDKGATGKDTMKVTVKPAIANKAPVANAGSDQTITLPKDSVSLSGSGSDSDGTIGSYLWKQIAGTAATITNSLSAEATVTGLIQGSYQFELTVTDNKGATGKDTMKVTVNPAVANKAPVADAGSDKTVTLPANSVQLEGSGSDIGGTVVSYAWTKIQGPASFSLVNSSSPICTINNLLEGTYKFQLIVTDDNGASARDTVTVTVNASDTLNKSPVADAGSDQSITLPANSVTISGTGSDSDGIVVSYHWTKISGPSSYNVENPSSTTTKITGLQQGIYEFELKVTDEKGGSGADTLKVTVESAIATSNPPSNSAPIADAGSDLTIVSSNNSVTLKGSGTDKDGQIVGYTWKQVSGPSTSNITSITSAKTNVQGLIEGTYQFELTVFDDKGAEGKDTMTVTVALERIAPKSTKLDIYPNPVHDIATVQVTLPQNNTNVTLVITNISGITVYKKQFVSGTTQVNQEIDMSNFGKGVYVVTVFFDSIQQQAIKVVKM